MIFRENAMNFKGTVGQIPPPQKRHFVTTKQRRFINLKSAIDNMFNLNYS
jgi:hypothetical protein